MAMLFEQSVFFVFNLMFGTSSDGLSGYLVVFQMLTDKHYQVNLVSANRSGLDNRINCSGASALVIFRTLFPDTSLSLIERAGPEELNILAKKLYSDFHGVDESEKQFDFLIQKVLLRTSIGDFVVDNNLPSENVIVIECIDCEPAPDPCFSLPHKDWVSGVRCASDCFPRRRAMTEACTLGRWLLNRLASSKLTRQL
ncbi:Ribosome biogenesis protein WDR12 homolog [Trichuris trichiura]|uniref:Ribosome biogenesis protein WDR12 homolog n=1 Tax=Trichuris trichiura TaxID=36087 RepID=A0A077ZEI0_TRITR|nr:Ribosome biogenesis protein WDR12 homolog [Trichuris trichiura]